MAIVKDLLQRKIVQVWYVTPTSSVRDALKLMAEQKIGAVLVVEAGNIVGIFSERDFARRSIQGSVDLNTPVGALMHPGVYYVTPDQTIEACMALMTSKHIRHLPVLDAERRQLEVEEALARSRSGVLLYLVALYKSLGGGWTEGAGGAGGAGPGSAAVSATPAVAQAAGQAGEASAEPAGK